MNSRLLKQSLAVVMICLGLSSNVWGQSASVHIGSTYGNFCAQPPGLQLLPINFQAAGPVATARFKVVSSSPVTFFDPPNGEFFGALSPCRDYGSLGMLVVLIPPGPAVTFTVVPATGHSQIEVIDCDGYALPTVQECEEYQELAPYRPDPPNGATDVPTGKFLSYIGNANYVALSTNPNMYIFDPANTVLCSQPGTDETPPPCPLPLNPGVLQPHTTYYWRAVERCSCGQVATGYSELFSFTTDAGPVAVEPATWGHVKAMYRR